MTPESCPDLDWRPWELEVCPMEDEDDQLDERIAPDEVDGVALALMDALF